MKAAIRRKYCLPNLIKVEEIEKPGLKTGEILIRVKATTVNRTDCANLTAKPFIMRFLLGLLKPRKIILGTDFAGEVLDLGADVESVKIGDRVFGFRDSGTLSQAEYIAISEKDVYPIPANIDFKHAAASIEGAHYAYTFIQKADIQPGQHILINGATGGIGSALLQFVRQYDVRITATCNTQNAALIESLGADRIIDYTKVDFTKDHERYDHIFDAVGKSTFGQCKPILKPKGTYISSELGPYSQNLLFALLSGFSKGKKVIFPVPFSTKVSIPYIINLLEQNKFRPVLDREYALADISKAYEYVMKGQKTGNVVLKI